ncbi:hypothetical protein RJ55_02112 [Drechmeria coniospora]|nr:hypothetical protein RJ55_02112 [Drechmeria coniospora]
MRDQKMQRKYRYAFERVASPPRQQSTLPFSLTFCFFKPSHPLQSDTWQKEGWDEEFDTEKTAHEKITPLQGIVVPVCYGELQYEGARSLLLSDIGGGNLATPRGALLEVTDHHDGQLQ